MIGEIHRSLGQGFMSLGGANVAIYNTENVYTGTLRKSIYTHSKGRYAECMVMKWVHVPEALYLNCIYHDPSCSGLVYI